MQANRGERRERMENIPGSGMLLQCPDSSAQLAEECQLAHFSDSIRSSITRNSAATRLPTASARCCSSRPWACGSTTQLSEVPGLQKVAEGGEYEFSYFSESAETFSVETFGRIISLTRQALINDDLNAFTRIPASFGASARRLEADLVYAKLTGSDVMSDGKTLFHASHGNLLIRWPTSICRRK
jgi:hypothetical protein